MSNLADGTGWLSSEQLTDLDVSSSLEISNERAIDEFVKANKTLDFLRQKTLVNVVAKIRESLDLSIIFQSTATEVRQLLNADRVVVYRFLPDTNCCMGEIVSEDVLPQFSSALAARVEDPCFGNQKQAQKYRDGHVGQITDVLALNLDPCYLEILTRFEVRANLVVPLLQANNLWGLVCIHQCAAPREWQNIEIQFVQEIGLHLSVAIQQAEFVSQLQFQAESLNIAVQKAVAREKALAQTIDKIRRSLDLETIFQTTVQEVQRLLQADRVVIYRFNPDWSGEFVSESAAPGWLTLIDNQHLDPRISRNASNCSIKMLSHQTSYDSYLMENEGEVFVRGQVFRVCDDIYAANFTECYLNVLSSYQARAYIITAIFQGEKLWGLLAAFQNSGPRQWQADEIKFMVQISGQLGVATLQAILLEQSRQRSLSLQNTLEQELRNRADQLALEAQQERNLAKVIRVIRQTLDPDFTFPATSELRQILDCDRLTIYRFAQDWSGEFVYESLNEDNPALFDPKSPWSDQFLQSKQGWIYQQHESIIVPNIQTMGFPSTYVKFLEEHQIHSFISVPIFLGNNLWGLLAVYQHNQREWQPREVRLLNQVSHQIGVALQQSELLIQEKQATATADAANRAKSQFLAHMSHELRTPLNSILGFAQLLKRDSELLVSHHEYLGIIVRSGEHLLTLINDVLEMSKIEAGQINLNKDSFNLRNLLCSIKEMLSLKAESKGLKLNLSYGENVPQLIKADEQKLRQILINLMGNGIKFTEAGEVTIRVDLDNAIDDRCYVEGICDITFEVEDTGYGIAADQIDTLFEPFIQSDIGKKFQEGTGLGLTISKRFVELMSGKISVFSSIGKGSLFKFTIPVAIDDQLVEQNNAPRKIIFNVNQSPNRILICEDHLDSSLMLQDLIAGAGFEVQTAANGQEAIDRWQLWQPHLIWMDMQMPLMDGYEATKQIRAIEKQANIPLNKAVKIIALTTSVVERDRYSLMSAGCDDFMSKPFQTDQILGKLAEHLNLTYDCLPEYYNDNSPANSSDYSPSNSADYTIQSKSGVETESQLNKAMHAAEDLINMPKIWLEQLSLSARAADEDAIAILICQIPENKRSLVEYLSYLVESFQLERIIRILEPLI
jgi:two-component system, sensor histidine kinase and response regulator